MSNFNGVIYPTIFDKEQEFTTLGNDDDSQPFRFKLQKSILYKGKAEVKNGEFEFTFVIPKDISYAYGTGKISYYASNDSIDANGYSSDLIIGGSYDLAETDDLGPEIKLYMNDSSFIFGGITNQNPSLMAQVHDEHGINTSGNGIGHDITAILDENSLNPIILNDYYQADYGNYKKGVIRYPFYNLEDGLHTLSIKVWDVYNNSSEDYTEFLVISREEMALENLYNAPNPFSDFTSIVFEHNQSCETMDIQVQIFNTMGLLVKEIKGEVQSSGFRVGLNQIVWDGTGTKGEPLGKGVYIYRLRIKNTSGEYQELSNKMVLLR
jgi:hypothetical protein